MAAKKLEALATLQDAGLPSSSYEQLGVIDLRMLHGRVRAIMAMHGKDVIRTLLASGITTQQITGATIVELAELAKTAGLTPIAPVTQPAPVSPTPTPQEAPNVVKDFVTQLVDGLEDSIAHSNGEIVLRETTLTTTGQTPPATEQAQPAAPVVADTYGLEPVVTEAVAAVKESRKTTIRKNARKAANATQPTPGAPPAETVVVLPVKAPVACQPISGPLPTPNDESWIKYVLSQFFADEMEGEHPRVDGLRRVAEKLIGPIVSEKSTLVCPPSIDNGMRACASAQITFRTVSLGDVVVEALADASPDNCPDTFQMYLTTMADTRAKGRCFRNALRLRKTIAAEESRNTQSGEFAGDGTTSDAISIGQITNVKILSDRLRLSIPRLLAKLELPLELKSLSCSDALVVFSAINRYRAEGIPDDLKRGD